MSKPRFTIRRVDSFMWFNGRIIFDGRRQLVFPCKDRYAIEYHTDTPPEIDEIYERLITRFPKDHFKYAQVSVNTVYALLKQSIRESLLFIC